MSFAGYSSELARPAGLGRDPEIREDLKIDKGRNTRPLALGGQSVILRFFFERATGSIFAV
jgi:hypothetical protein